jgi:hypothetical protein
VIFRFLSEARSRTGFVFRRTCRPTVQKQDRVSMGITLTAIREVSHIGVSAMRRMTLSTVVMMVAGLGGFAVPVAAAVVSPLNGSFESPAFSSTTNYISALPTSWDAAPGATSQIIHHPAVSPYLYPAPADGITLYGIECGPGYASGIQQTLGTMTAGESYTFQAMLYSNSEGLHSYYRISLFNVTDNRELKAITESNFDPSAGGILNSMPASFTYTAVAADNGDTVRLIVTSPTPTSLTGRTGVDAVTVSSTFEPPGLVHQWTFQDGTAKDSVGGANGTLINGAAIVSQGGRIGLQLDGINDYMRTSTIPNAITEKTLVAWVKLDNLTQQSGGVLTLENPTGADTFDSIVYGERTANQWMNGSNGHVRSDGTNNGGALEASTEDVMLAIAYGPGGLIEIYRNGQLYASYTTGGPITYPASIADVILGARHLDAAGGTGTWGGNDPFLAGFIDEARIYNRALTPAEILYLFNQGAVVPEPSTLALLIVGGGGLLGLTGLRRTRRRA